MLIINYFIYEAKLKYHKSDKLITLLRNAIDNEGTLDKEAMSYNDIFDAYRLVLKICYPSN
ncbi:MAG: hypothetical protein WCF23_00615 [Candidatus Nitrosopolaris sp.]